MLKYYCKIIKKNTKDFCHLYHNDQAFSNKLSNQNKQDPVSVSDNNARQTRKLNYNALSKLQFNFIFKVTIIYEIMCLSWYKRMRQQASLRNSRYLIKANTKNSCIIHKKSLLFSRKSLEKCDSLFCQSHTLSDPIVPNWDICTTSNTILYSSLILEWILDPIKISPESSPPNKRQIDCWSLCWTEFSTTYIISTFLFPGAECSIVYVYALLLCV